MGRKLYIIGNGFDLAHKLTTSYRDYYSFVKENANKSNGWDIILEYYPEYHEFWSDAETNICLINRSRFLDLKRVFNVTDIDILLSKIRESFESFIINVEKQVDGLEPEFELDMNSLFLTFNYTSVLESVYKIPEDNVVHLHNTAGDAVMKRYFGFLDSDEIVLGHGPNYRHFLFWSDNTIGNDKDYISFRNKTLKNSSEIIKKYNLQYKLLKLQKIIDEVVFYGFSFSPNDQEYVQTLFMCLSLPTTKFKLFYYVKDGETDQEVVERYQDNIIKCACDPNKVLLIKCNNVKNI